MVERFNQTLQAMLVKFVSSKKRQWSSFLDTCVYAYNTSRQESTQFTPFQLMFCRRAILPIELNLQQDDPEKAAAECLQLDNLDVAQVQSEHMVRLEKAKENIVAAQEKQKAVYDKKHAKPSRFTVGQLVLKKDFTRKKRKGGKLDM